MDLPPGVTIGSGVWSEEACWLYLLYRRCADQLAHARLALHVARSRASLLHEKAIQPFAFQACAFVLDADYRASVVQTMLATSNPRLGECMLHAHWCACGA